MKTFVPFLSMLLIVVSCTQRLDKISLNGEWRFFASNDIAEGDVLSDKGIHWDNVTVPGNWDTQEKYSEFVGKGYYKRTFDVPANWRESQIRLKFDAVYETSKVWLNGILLGKHVGGYTPFEFVVTDKVNYSETNELLVMADNTYMRGAWWAWGGISRNVSLHRYNEIRIISQHISAIPDFAKDQINFIVTYKLENNSGLNQSIILKTYISDNKEVVLEKQQEVVIDANTERTSKVTFTEPLEKYKLWHFDHPNLYQLHSEVMQDEESICLKKDNFGIRKLEAKGEQLYLNNQVVYMNGFNRVHDHPDYGNTEPYSLVLKDISDIKALGGVFSRLMHAPQAKSLLDICDSLGYLLIEEIPVWGHDDPQTFKDNPVTKRWLKEMIERDYNHPCVVGWSVGNELRNSNDDWEEIKLSEDQFAYINSMLDYIDELDTTRLKTYVSLTAYKKNADLSNEPFEKLDIICINSYGNAVKAAVGTHEKFPGKPIFLSEIGIKQIGPAPDGKLPDELVSQLNGLKKLPYVVGSSLWSYNDYRSNYKGTPESGFREWGVVDERRNKKVAYEQIKEVYSR